MTDHTRLALALFGELRKGRFAEDVGKHLEELLDACADTRKPGTITLAITVTPNGKVDGADQYTFKDKISTKAPQEDAGSYLLYRNQAGELTRQDPRQPMLPSIAAGQKQEPASA